MLQVKKNNMLNKKINFATASDFARNQSTIKAIKANDKDQSIAIVAIVALMVAIVAYSLFI